ncbi:MAG: cytochrome b N-terminal domain-containing protein [Candidatus Binataceae bacterium]|nr:cytochrome b N-terminal domain-containing protein [Candidatus Binataceae bacterium]
MRNILKRAVDAFEDRTGLISFFGYLMRHPVPGDTGWWYVFGSAVLVAFMIQVVTGIALATRYVASSGSAYQVLQFITYHAVLGNFLRGMHFFGASAMILLVGVHMIQVFLMGCYKYPREFNWISGVMLLFVTIAMGFSGQLLRWDQTAVWATVLAAEMLGRTPFIGKYLARFLLGGKTLGGATLSRFFAFHVFFLPAAIFMFVGLHLYLVIHDGISAMPVPGQKVNPETYRAEYEKLLEEHGVPFWPDAAWRDVVVAFGVVVTIAALAYFVGPPHLGEPPNPSVLANDPSPDWYMLWYYAVLALLPRGMESVFMVAAPMAAIVFLLLVPVLWNKGERHPSRRPWAVAAVIMIVLSLTAFWIEGSRAPWSPKFDAQPLSAAQVGTTSPPIVAGALLFHDNGCEFCHTVDGHGGMRGPDLTDVAHRLSVDDLRIRIANGGGNMPSFAGILTHDDLDNLVAFLESRETLPAAPAQAASAHP